MSRSVSRISRPMRILFLAAIAMTLVIWLLLFLVTDLHVGITRNINLTTNNATSFGKSDVVTPMTRDSSSQYINLSLYTLAQQASEALRMFLFLLYLHSVPRSLKSQSTFRYSSSTNLTVPQLLSLHHGRTSTSKCSAKSIQTTNSPMECINFSALYLTFNSMQIAPHWRPNS